MTKPKKVKEGRYYRLVNVCMGQDCREIVYIQYIGLNGRINGWTYRWGFNPTEEKFAWTTTAPAFSFTDKKVSFLEGYKLVPKDLEKYISPFAHSAENYPSKLARVKRIALSGGYLR